MTTRHRKKRSPRADKRYDPDVKPGDRWSVARKNPEDTAADTKARAGATLSARDLARSRRTQGRTHSLPYRLALRFGRWIMRSLWAVVWRVALVLALIVGGATAWFAQQIPPYQELIDGRWRGSVSFVDAQGATFAWRGDTFQPITSLADVSPHLVNAILATEDRRFYRHLGVSPRGVAQAMIINLREGRTALEGHGGSTLTQQTAKLLCLGVPFDPTVWTDETAYEDDCRRTTIGRKLREAVYALALELRLSKDEILTVYLNRAYLGAGSRGFAAAAERYFDVPVRDLSPAQAAMLAGLLVAPSRLAPTRDLALSQDRADTVIRLMHEQGYLSAVERDTAWANPATLSEAAQARAGGYFADWLLNDVVPPYLGAKTTEDVILTTTLDPAIQRAAEEAIATVFDEKVRAGSAAQAAIVIMSPDGAVRAMVGGRQTRVTGAFNRATQAVRQTGSAFKPFVYAAALDLGRSPNDILFDQPYCIAMPSGPRYCPRNYANTYAGEVTLTRALAESLNIPAVKLQEIVGREAVRKVAADFGLLSDLAAGPSLALGVSETTLLEMTAAYAGILNGGRAVRPYGITELRLQGETAPLVDGGSSGLGERVISEQAARELVWMMSRVIEEGSGQRARLPGHEAAGKTGTSQNARDAWFIGFTADYVAGVWMGNDDNVPLVGVTGGGLPADIWHEAMMRVTDGRPARPLPADPEAATRPGTTLEARRAPPPVGERTTSDGLLNEILGDMLFRR